MIKVLFVCHGNICRSPMAESVMTYMVKLCGLEKEFEISSAAAHRDELGNPPHAGTREILRQKGIPLVKHYARLLTVKDGEEYDYLIGMDDYNVHDMQKIVGEPYRKKVYKLLDFTSTPRAIADPWYTGDFELTYRDVEYGCKELINFLREKHGI